MVNIADDEKVGQKRPNKEELNRGLVSSSSEGGSDEEISKEKEVMEVKTQGKVNPK